MEQHHRSTFLTTIGPKTFWRTTLYQSYTTFFYFTQLNKNCGQLSAAEGSMAQHLEDINKPRVPGFDSKSKKINYKKSCQTKEFNIVAIQPSCNWIGVRYLGAETNCHITKWLYHWKHAKNSIISGCLLRIKLYLNWTTRWSHFNFGAQAIELSFDEMSPRRIVLAPPMTRFFHEDEMSKIRKEPKTSALKKIGPPPFEQNKSDITFWVKEMFRMFGTFVSCSPFWINSFFLSRRSDFRFNGCHRTRIRRSNQRKWVKIVLVLLWLG